MIAWLSQPLVWVMALVVIQRLGELVIAGRNTRRLLARGGREIGAGHYPVMVAMHASWLAAVAFTTPVDTQPDWALLGAYLVLQFARVWVITTLNKY